MSLQEGYDFPSFLLFLLLDNKHNSCDQNEKGANTAIIGGVQSMISSESRKLIRGDELKKSESEFKT